MYLLFRDTKGNISYEISQQKTYAQVHIIQLALYLVNTCLLKNKGLEEMIA